MPGKAGSRARKSDEVMANGPVAKKLKLGVSRSVLSPIMSIETAVFSNGISKNLTARLSKQPISRTSHAVQDANTTVSTAIGQTAKNKKVEIVEISSNSSSSDDDEDSSDLEEDIYDGDDGEIGEVTAKAKPARQPSASPTINGINSTSVKTGHADAHVNGNSESSDKQNEMQDDQDVEVYDEPTFGDLIQAAPVHVDSMLGSASEESPVLLRSNTSLPRSIPTTATSLSTVLTQAIKTNDREMLESCFLTHDLDSVRATISRLHSSLIEDLLHKIADKMHKRPGRANNLMVWVQWSLVAHGGYLATRKELVAKLGALHRVIRERANGLQPLLALKGKLDMLSAQLDLRREAMEANRRNIEDEDEEVAIYVEAEELETKPLVIRHGSNDHINGSDLDLDAAAVSSRDDDDGDSSASEEYDDDQVSEDGFSDQQEEEDDEEEENEITSTDEEDQDEIEGSYSRKKDKQK